jgi:hypothetical protein
VGRLRTDRARDALVHPPKYGLVSPTQIRRLWHNNRVGLEMGRKAKLASPSDRVALRGADRPRPRRARPPRPQAAGVLASGHSVLAEWFYPMKKKPA